MVGALVNMPGKPGYRRSSFGAGESHPLAKLSGANVADRESISPQRMVVKWRDFLPFSLRTVYSPVSPAVPYQS